MSFRTNGSAIRRASALAVTILAVAWLAVLPSRASAAQAPALPTIFAMSQHHGTWLGGERMSIRGTNFRDVKVIGFGGVAATDLHLVSSSTLWVTTPRHHSKDVWARVLTGAGISPRSRGSEYSFGSTPRVTGLDMVNGPAAGGTHVRIFGRAFVRYLTVRLDGSAPPRGIHLVDSTEIDIVMPPHAAGVVHLIVDTVFGSSPAVEANEFTYS